MTLPEDAAEVTQLVRAAGTSFYYGMRILPPERRLAIYAVYAFCRVIDDIVDEPGEVETKDAQLACWRARIRGLEAGEADDALTRVLCDSAAHYGLPREDFLAVIDGMAMDAKAPIVAPDLSTLDLYCELVASAVGRLSVRIFGDSSPLALEVAHHLGRALQLTNILRDLAEDAKRGRLYLPHEFLAAASLPADPQAALASPHLAAACRPLADLAEAHFALAEAAMAKANPRAMRPARLMAASYRPLLAAMRRRGFTDPARPVRLSPWQRLGLALQLALPW